MYDRELLAIVASMKQCRHPREVFPDNQGYERLSTLRLATSATSNHQYLFANVVEIEPIEKDLFVEIAKAHRSDQLATDLLRRMRATT
jgi:hypothetical protein